MMYADDTTVYYSDLAEQHNTKVQVLMEELHQLSLWSS